MSVILGVVVVGYIAGVVATLWWFHDVRRFPRKTWYWCAINRRAWKSAIIAGALTGWPAVIVAFVWRGSDQRDILMTETVDLAGAEQDERAETHKSEKAEKEHPEDAPSRPTG